MKTDVTSLTATVGATTAERAQYLQRIKALENTLDESRKAERSLKPLASPTISTIVLPHVDVEITSDEIDGEQSLSLVGKFRGSLVTFERVPHQSPEKVVNIYEQISQVALVQELKGIVEYEGKLFAMMASMEPHPPVEKAIQDGIFSSMDSVDVLRYIYELAATVSALHAAGLLIKVISDRSVFVVRGSNGMVRPKISNLDQARAVCLFLNTPEHSSQNSSAPAFSCGLLTGFSPRSSSFLTGIVCFSCRSGKLPIKLRKT